MKLKKKQLKKIGKKFILRLNPKLNGINAKNIIEYNFIDYIILDNKEEKIMAYIINTSTVAAVTLNLSQGRVQLEPQQYCELHDNDLEKAKACYNNKDLNLYLAMTKEELDLILQDKHQKTEMVNIKAIEEGAVVISDRPLPIPTIDNAGQSVDDIEDEDDVEDDIEDEDNVEDDIEDEDDVEDDIEDEDNVEDEDEAEDAEWTDETPAPVEDVEEETKEEEDQTAKLAKENLQAQIEILRGTDNLEGLKDLATKLSVPYTHNIKAETLANKLLEYLK